MGTKEISLNLRLKLRLSNLKLLLLNFIVYKKELSFSKHFQNNKFQTKNNKQFIYCSFMFLNLKYFSLIMATSIAEKLQ